MKSIENISLKPHSSVREALEIIDKGQMKIALVVDINKCLLGTVSDGDIRRVLLDGLDLSLHVDKVMNKDFIYAKSGDSREKILQLSEHNQVYQIPIINENFNVIGIEDVSNFFLRQNYSNKIVLMVGGLGTRLKPLTDNTPKSLLKVGHKPILETIVENFAKYGFKDFIFAVNYKSEMIENYFRNGKKFGVNIKYVYESKRMGTAGALSLIKKELNEDFFVMNGDLLTNINFEHLLKFHQKSKAKATMCVREYDFQVPYGVVNVVNNKIASIEEKPIHKFFVNAGIYMLSPTILNFIPEDSFFDMPILFNILAKNKEKAISFPIREYWLDIGEIEEYKRANIEYSENFGDRNET